MKNRMAPLPPVEDDTTLKQAVTPDMWEATEKEAPVRAVQHSSGLRRAAILAILPAAVTLGWWTGAETTTATAPALPAPAAVVEPMVMTAVPTAEPLATCTNVQQAAPQGLTIPVVAAEDLPLEPSEQAEALEPPPNNSRLRSKRVRSREAGRRPTAIDAQ